MNDLLFRDSLNRPRPLPHALVARELTDRIDGEALDTGSPGYDDARSVWNAMIDRRPALLVRCAHREDVRRCAAFAATHGIAITVKGGGHNIAGRALRDGALTIDLSRWREVRPRDATEQMHVAPGCTLGDVDRATTPQGLVLPSGIVSETGIAGLTLGGGFGWLSRRHGLTCDHLIAAEVVSGTGDVVLADESEHADLLWALRGGGGAGIVTDFRFRLRPLQDPVLAGPIVQPGAQARDALRRLRSIDREATDEQTVMVKLGRVPPLPVVPAAEHGRPGVLTVVCHSGARPEPEVAKLRDRPQVLADLVQPRRFVDFQTFFDAGEPRGRRNYWRSEYATDLDDELLDILVDAHARLPSAQANLKVFQLGGAVARGTADRSAASHRDARFLIVIATAWDSAAHDGEQVAWVRDIHARVHGHIGRGGYANFLPADADTRELAAARRDADGARLAAIAARYDPAGTLTAAGAGQLRD